MSNNLVAKGDHHISPFKRPGAITAGRTVMYHHPDDKRDYPAMVSQVRGIDGTGEKIDPATFPEDVRDEAILSIEERSGGFTLECALTIFRTGAIEYRWSSESKDDRGWSWPVRV